MSRNPLTLIAQHPTGPDLLIHPRLLNSASLWATTFDDLLKLYQCPSTGAITTRTCLLEGFGHDPSIHQHCFVDTQDPGKTLHRPESDSDRQAHRDTPAVEAITSLNTLGYSPIYLAEYLNWAVSIYARGPASVRKPFIFSVTGSPDDILACFQTIAERRRRRTDILPPFHLEINLSCPNITDNPPPAYSRSSLAEYLGRAAEAKRREPALHNYSRYWGREAKVGPRQYEASPIYIGLKLPPYTYATQFSELIAALRDSARIRPLERCPINFITTTNTLGSSLLLTTTTTNDGQHNSRQSAIASASGTGIGGLAGAALHPLALGNVATLRDMLDEHDELGDIQIIGVGGVSDRAGYERMRSAGADAVGVATALGFEGVDVFEKILKGGEGVKDKQEAMVEDETREVGTRDGSDEGKPEGRMKGHVRIEGVVRVEGKKGDKDKGDVKIMGEVRLEDAMSDKEGENKKRKSDHLE